MAAESVRETKRRARASCARIFIIPLANGESPINSGDPPQLVRLLPAFDPRDQSLKRRSRASGRAPDAPSFDLGDSPDSPCAEIARGERSLDLKQLVPCQ